MTHETLQPARRGTGRRLAGACVVAAMTFAAAGEAREADGATSEQKLQRAEKKIEAGRERAGVLTSRLDELGERVSGLEDSVELLRQEESDAAERLAEAEDELREANALLTRSVVRFREVREHLGRAVSSLERRLVAIYMSGSLDVASMVFASTGFDELVEGTTYLDAIRTRDENLVSRVRGLRDEVKEIVKRRRDARATIKASRDRIAAQKQSLAAARIATEARVTSLGAARAANEAALAEVEGRIEQHEEVAEELRVKIAAEVGAATAPNSTGPTDATAGTGEMIWPIDGTLTSPFGPRWGRVHEGLDIAAPEGTPIYAAASGTVVLMQSEAESGGYGLFTCVDHGGGVSTCYAHQSGFATSTGASVKQGDLIGYVGNTGNSYGAHVHFEVRIDGAATDPMAYL